MTEQTLDDVNFQWRQSSSPKKTMVFKKVQPTTLPIKSKETDILLEPNQNIDENILFNRILELKDAVKIIKKEG